jgi:TM2 domain-containing membrane protein YozV
MSKETSKGKKADKNKAEVAPREKPKQRSWRVALLLSLFLGFFGADRFYIGRTKSAIAKLLSVGGVGVWWLSDFILIASDWRKDADGQPLKH